ncbi:MAG: NAD(P)H-hydrate dehydratase [Planctomycetota bacterium]
MRRIGEVPRIRPLKREAHKGDRGRVLLVAGSQSMSGAARLAGWGALRGGAGLVTIATPDIAQPIVAADLPCAMSLPLPSRKGALTATGAAAALEKAKGMDAVGVGPGLTTSVAPFLRKFLKRLTQPVVLDADALSLLAKHDDLVPPGPRILTPHPGEASRLLGREVPGDAKGRVAAAEELADKWHAVVVLKGAASIVTDADRVFVNRSGNPGMACGGSGDVLTGLITARLAWGMDPLSAAIQAVWLHGRAGDLAVASVGQAGMIASDIVANLPGALSELVETPKRAAKRTGSRRRG